MPLPPVLVEPLERLTLTPRGRGRRAPAVVAAVLIHLILLLGLLPSARGTQLSLGRGAGEGTADTVALSLGGLEGSSLPFVRHRQPVKPTASDGMDSLFKRLSANSDNAAAAPKEKAAPDAAKLLDAVADNRPDSDGADKPAQPTDKAKAGDGGSGGTRGSARGAATVKTARVGGGDGAPAKGSFAGQVEACWKKLPGRSSVPVMLEVAIDGRGLIARPPMILRPPSSRLDEQRLIAEERAIRALSACVPYRGAAAGETYHLEFRAGR